MLVLAVMPGKVAAWGDDGHKAAALIAKRQVGILLAADTDDLTGMTSPRLRPHTPTGIAKPTAAETITRLSGTVRAQEVPLSFCHGNARENMKL
jgi:hypothetical protein